MMSDALEDGEKAFKTNLQNMKATHVHIAKQTLPIAITASLLVQMGHEAVHALTTWLVGAQVVWFNLFAVNDAGASPTGSLLISGSAALVNILLALACIALFSNASLKARPSLRLFVFYFGAFNLFTGFGYLMTNGLFYSSGRLGDWNSVIAYYDGSWAVRLPVILIGVAGTLYGFFWVPQSAQHFVANPTDKAERVAWGLGALLIPYLVINTLMTILAIWHPLGTANGVLLVGLHYWFGYFAVGWGFPMCALWLTRNLPSKDDTTPLPNISNLIWFGLVVILFIICLLVLFPVPQI